MISCDPVFVSCCIINHAMLTHESVQITAIKKEMISAGFVLSFVPLQVSDDSMFSLMAMILI